MVFSKKLILWSVKLFITGLQCTQLVFTQRTFSSAVKGNKTAFGKTQPGGKGKTDSP